MSKVKRWVFRLSTGHVLAEVIAASLPLSDPDIESVREAWDILQLASFIAATGAWEPTEAITA